MADTPVKDQKDTSCLTSTHKQEGVKNGGTKENKTQDSKQKTGGWVRTPFGFGRIKEVGAAVSSVEAKFGTIYLPTKLIKDHIELKVTTFYKKKQHVLMKLRPDQTGENIRDGICKKFACSREEVRLVLRGVELTSEQIRSPVSTLQFPIGKEGLEILFVHESSHNFKFEDPSRRSLGGELNAVSFDLIEHLCCRASSSPSLGLIGGLHLSSNKLSVTKMKKDRDHTVRGNVLLTKGKTFWDVHIDNSKIGRINLGVCVEAQQQTVYVGQNAHGWGYYGSNGEQSSATNKDTAVNETSLPPQKEHASRSDYYGQAYTTGDTVRVMVDMESRTLAFKKNSEDYGIAFKNIPSRVYPAFTLYNVGDKITLRRFGTF
eukprot:jgi/Bigna1/76169/fgenesh1_pg.39_\